MLSRVIVGNFAHILASCTKTELIHLISPLGGRGIAIMSHVKYGMFLELPYSEIQFPINYI